MITFADDLISGNKMLTEKQRKKVAKFYKQLEAHLDIKFYDFGDITITIMKPKKRRNNYDRIKKKINNPRD